MVECGTYIVPTFVVMEAEFPKGVPVPMDPASSYVSDRLQQFWTALRRLPRLGDIRNVNTIIKDGRVFEKSDILKVSQLPVR